LHERLVAARTWLTVPAAASMPSAHSVWIESTTTRCGGLPSLRVARMLERLVSDASATGALSRPRRSERNRTWLAASSPVK
jgi:hypothetical protein